MTNGQPWTHDPGLSPDKQDQALPSELRPSWLWLAWLAWLAGCREIRGHDESLFQGLLSRLVCVAAAGMGTVVYCTYNMRTDARQLWMVGIVVEC